MQTIPFDIFCLRGSWSVVSAIQKLTRTETDSGINMLELANGKKMWNVVAGREDSSVYVYVESRGMSQERACSVRCVAR